MSTYPYRSYHFLLRPGAEAQRAALLAVAAGRPVTAAELDPLHPTAARYLAHPPLFLADEDEPRIGTPVRMAQDGMGGTRLSIEFCLHDDDFADDGWLFWLWVLDLVARPMAGQTYVIGYEGLYRNDREMRLTRATAAGIVVGDDEPISFDAITDHLQGS